MGDKFEYECKTSVAPQQLQTATVQIKHPEDSGITNDRYCVLPHMIVWNMKEGADKPAKHQTCFMHSSFDKLAVAQIPYLTLIHI